MWSVGTRTYRGNFIDLDGRGSGFLIHGCSEATALNHETGNYSMENCIGVMTIIGIALEVGTGV